MTEFAYTILLVKDLEKSKQFYVQYFDQRLEVDTGIWWALSPVWPWGSRMMLRQNQAFQKAIP